MSKKESQTKNGADYRDTIRQMSGGSFMCPTNFTYYLKGSELAVFVFLCSSINKFDQCTESAEQIARNIGLNPKVVNRIIERMVKMGVILQFRGRRITYRRLNYDNIANVSDIIEQHPFIAYYLREVMGDNDIADINHDKVMLALNRYKDENGIEKKVRNIPMTDDDNADFVTDEISLFGD